MAVCCIVISKRVKMTIFKSNMIQTNDTKTEDLAKQNQKECNKNRQRKVIWFQY